MTLPETIKKAIEGGWRYKKDDQLFTDAGKFLDPTFWQSLGKELGWEEPIMNELEWKKQQHSFISHLADGKSIESFFEGL